MCGVFFDPAEASFISIEREVREAINVAYKLIISEKNKKRDIRDWYQQQQSGSDRYRDQPDGNNDIYRRGDIPVLHGDCDGE